MKLIIAIIQDEDASEVISHLNEAKFQVTRLSTKGGFLRAGNTTIMTGVEDEKVEGALKIIEENSKARTQYATLPSSCGAMHGRCNGICTGCGAVPQILIPKKSKERSGGFVYI